MYSVENFSLNVNPNEEVTLGRPMLMHTEVGPRCLKLGLEGIALLLQQLEACMKFEALFRKHRRLSSLTLRGSVISSTLVSRKAR